MDASGVDAEASASERPRPDAGSQPPNATVIEEGTTGRLAAALHYAVVAFYVIPDAS